MTAFQPSTANGSARPPESAGTACRRRSRRARRPIESATAPRSVTNQVAEADRREVEQDERDVGAGEVVGGADAEGHPERRRDPGAARERGERAGPPPARGRPACPRPRPAGRRPGPRSGALFSGGTRACRFFERSASLSSRCAHCAATTSMRRFAARPRAVKFGRSGLSPPRPAQVEPGAPDAELQEPLAGGARHRAREPRVRGAVCSSRRRRPRAARVTPGDAASAIARSARPPSRSRSARAAGERDVVDERRARPRRAAAPTPPGAACSGCATGRGRRERPRALWERRRASGPPAPGEARTARSGGARGCARGRSTARGRALRAARASGARAPRQRAAPRPRATRLARRGPPRCARRASR